MWAFSRTVLVGGIWACELDGVPEVGKRAMNLATLSEFTATIHANISVRTIWGVIRQPIVDPVNRRCLGCKSLAIQVATEVVG
jgi:hypothetical protein